jgi:hypothetical protein
MIFISFLRAIASCLITNAHYTDIYPLEIIANGGLLGDVIFFAVSGYCLYHIKTGFFPWYGKRLLRCYVPVFICTLVYILLGAYSLEEWTIFDYFVYPTYYHFVASIVLLYVPFYFIMKFSQLRERLPYIIIGILFLMLIIYVFVYDKSYYHIDNVRQWMIRFLFFESMLLGALFRQRDNMYRGKRSLPAMIGTIIFAIGYFICKISLSKGLLPYELQILNQFVLYGFLICIFRYFIGLDQQLPSAPNWVKKFVDFIAGRTLEIYLVQYVLIDLLRPVGKFPLNWICITASIILSASVLHFLSEFITRRITKLIF